MEVLWPNNSNNEFKEKIRKIKEYIESLFRKDFILRINAGSKKYRDNITKEYKSIYIPDKRVYSYSLVDVIFRTWKQYVSPNSKEIEDVFRTLPQYYDFRNWIAHGRYWIPKETNYIQKYSYLQIVILYDKIVALLGDKLKKWVCPIYKQYKVTAKTHNYANSNSKRDLQRVLETNIS